MTYNRQEWTLWSGGYCAFNERNTAIGNEICEIIFFIAHLAPFLVCVMSDDVVVKL